MVRATTPTHKFVLPFDYDAFVTKCIVTYSQCGKIVLEKRDDEVLHDGNVLTVHLSQEETKLFGAFAQVDVQIRVLTNTEDVLASQIFHLNVRNVLNDEVLK
jgi:hypothetical protein